MSSGEGLSSLPPQQNSLFSLLTHPSEAALPAPHPSFNGALPHPQPHYRPPSSKAGEIDLTGEGDDDDEVEQRPMAQRELKRAKHEQPGGERARGHHFGESAPSSFPHQPSTAPGASHTPAGWLPPLPLPAWAQQQHAPNGNGSSTSSFPAPPFLPSAFAQGQSLQASRQGEAIASSSSASSSSAVANSNGHSTQHGPSASFRQRRPKREPSPINVDDYPSPPPRQPTPPPPPPPPPASTNPQPTLIGYLETTALILYPSPYLDATVSPGEPPSRNYQRGEVLVIEDAEWGRVKLKHKPLAPGLASNSSETINILPFGVPSNQVEPFGVVASAVADTLGVFLSKGLIRVEGWILRGGNKSKFCQKLHLFLLTIPPNIAYVSNTLAEHNLFLGHPRLPWRAEWFQNCVYSNPHLDVNAANTTGRRNTGFSKPGGIGGSGGLSISAAAKVVEQQRSQVDEVFQSLKGGDDLDETHPGPWIGANLYPHQKKALTFLRERENEKLPPTGVRKKNFNPPTPGSLWVPMMEQTSRKGKSSSKPSSWEHRVTKEIVRNKPRECRGAILADDMGLGKSLSIVSLVASTIGTARKFAVKPLKTVRAPTISVDSPEDSDFDPSSSVDASHFAGAVFGMPSVLALSSESSFAKTARQQQSEAKRKEERARENHARRMRIKDRSRATLIVCPLTTVSNWEDQFMEHWKGPVIVSSGGGGTSGKEQVQMKKNGKKEISVPKIEPDSSDSNSSSDDDEEDPILRIYVYHGNLRKTDSDFLADFDVVITTFSTLATEFSKQTRTAEGAASSGSGTSTPVGKPEDEDSDGVMEVDADGVSVEAKELEKATKKRKRGKGAITNLGVPNDNEITSPLQQIEWFRVVLDEAHFIKDANTVAARASCYLEAERRICLTGTPIQNKLDDLWALIKFIRLEPFDDKSVWAEYVSSPAKYGDSIGVARLQVIMRHITLRRTKETKLASGETLLNLPPRKDKIVYLEFDEKEQAIYDEHHRRSKQDFDNMLEGGEDGKISNSNYVNILQSILRLRQICDHYLLINDKSAPDDDLDTGEPLEYEEAAAAIALHGINQRRAAAVMSFFKEEDMCVCSECDEDLSCLAAGPAIEDDGVKPPVKKGRGRRKVPQAILTKCQHLYCLACFKASIYAAWPKSLGGVGRSCSKCASGLRLATDCVEIVPPGSSEAVSSSEFAARAKSTKKTAPRRRRRELGSELVLSTKIRFLMDDLRAFSALNPHSANFGGNPVEKVFTGGGAPEEASISEFDEQKPQTVVGSQGQLQQQTLMSNGFQKEEAMDIKPSTRELGIASPCPPLANGLPASNGNGSYDAEMVDRKPFASPQPEAGPSYQNDPVFALANEVSHQPEFADEQQPQHLPPPPADIFADLEEPFLSDAQSGKPIKTIVFSQWTSMLDRIEDALADTGIKYDRLDGTMKRDDRTKAMERLKTDPACEVLLVSLRAGGVGLNLTVANRVYLIDPFWNPAVENQAVDRIHRLGQVRPVISTKYIMQHSMEEKMLEIQKKKQDLANMSLSQTMSKKELHEKRMEDLKTLFS